MLDSDLIGDLVWSSLCKSSVLTRCLSEFISSSASVDRFLLVDG